MEKTGAKWFQVFYKWLSILLTVSFVLIGAGILLKILLPEPFNISPTWRLLMGGLILAYGVARLIMIYFKVRKSNNSEATFR